MKHCNVNKAYRQGVDNKLNKVQFSNDDPQPKIRYVEFVNSDDKQPSLMYLELAQSLSKIHDQFKSAGATFYVENGMEHFSTQGYCDNLESIKRMYVFLQAIQMTDPIPLSALRELAEDDFMYFDELIFGWDQVWDLMKKDQHKEAFTKILGLLEKVDPVAFQRQENETLEQYSQRLKTQLTTLKQPNETHGARLPFWNEKTSSPEMSLNISTPNNKC